MIESWVVEALTELNPAQLYGLEIFLVVVLFAFSMFFVLRSSAATSKLQQDSMSKLINAQIQSQQSLATTAAQQAAASTDTKRVIQQNNEILGNLTKVVQDKRTEIIALREEIKILKQSISKEKIDYDQIDKVFTLVVSPKFEALQKVTASYTAAAEALLEALKGKEDILGAQLALIQEGIEVIKENINKKESKNAVE
mgnify:CR=1 FL=1